MLVDLAASKMVTMTKCHSAMEMLTMKTSVGTLMTPLILYGNC